MTIADFFEEPTIEGIARLFSPDRSRAAATPTAGGGRRVFFLDADAMGDHRRARDLARRLAPSYDVHPLPEPEGPDVTSVEDRAGQALVALRAAQPHGPYILGGYCLGGLVAVEAARRLVAAGEEVRLVVLVEAYPADAILRACWRAVQTVGRSVGAGERARIRALHEVRQVRRLWRSGALAVCSRASRWLASRLFAAGRARSAPGVPDPFDVWRPLAAAGWARAIYRGGRFRGKTVLFFSEEAARGRDPARPWRSRIQRLQVVRVPGSHLSCITEEVDSLAGRMKEFLDGELR